MKHPGNPTAIMLTGFLLASLFIFSFLLSSIPVEAALSDDIEIYDIDPPDTFEQNISQGEKARFVLVMKHGGTEGNITVLLSNISKEYGWHIEISEELIVLAPNSSRVVRVEIWPKVYEQGSGNSVSLRILVIRDSESHEIMRYYTVQVPTPEKEEKEEEGVDVVGFHIDLPESLDNEIGRFAVLALFWFVVTLIVIILLDPFAKQFTKKTKTEMDDLILQILRKPIFILIIFYGLIDSLNVLNLSDTVIDGLFRIYQILFFIILFYTFYKIFHGALEYVDRVTLDTPYGNKVHYTLVPTLTKVGTVIFFFIGLNVILGYLGLNLALLLGGLTLMGLVIAFAAQDTLSNFFAGIFLMLEPNFKQDDTIILGDTTYDVKDIGMRTTKLYDISNHALVIIPNNILANQKIVTLTEPDRRIKMNIEVGVSYGTDVELVEQTLLSIAKAHPEVLSESGSVPFVRFTQYGDSSLNFKLVFWVRDLSDRFRVRHEIMKGVYQKFHELGIEIPFPQRVVHFVKESKESGNQIIALEKEREKEKVRDNIMRQRSSTRERGDIDVDTLEDNEDDG